MNNWINIKFISLTFIGVCFAALTQYNSNAQTTTRRPILYFGARPVKSNYINRTNIEYCDDLFQFLRRHHSEFNFEKVNIVYQQRLYQEKEIKNSRGESVKLSVECGSNTITDERDNYLRDLKIKWDDELIQYPGKFSKPFWRTGTKMLLKRGIIMIYITHILKESFSVG